MSTPTYAITTADAPGACTVPGHEGADARVIIVAPLSDPAAPLVLTATVTPWRTEYTYPDAATPTTFITTADAAALPAAQQAALSDPAVAAALAVDALAVDAR